jgi:DNA mismatch repair protein MutL
MPIRVLPSNLIDQIAAGEVIERPASVVKELFENALDAGARRIDIDIERAGLGLIRVRDDGCGMSAEELPLALERHATSKITTLEDLEAIASFGFRGEALPSIASVARVNLLSCRADQQAWEITVEGGEKSALKPVAHPTGSSVEVRDLFYNVPARRRFVRSPGTEFGHILRQVERLALGVHTPAVRLRHNGREILNLPAALDPAAIERRLDRIVGAEFRGQALSIDQSIGPLRLTGWLGLPTAARAQTDLQFWFVNGRAVRDRLLGNAVRLGFRDVLYHGRHPSYVLYLTLDPRQIDVNAHPTKLELRFRDSRAVHDGVFRSVERALAATHPGTATPHAGPVRRDEIALALTSAHLPLAYGSPNGESAGAFVAGELRATAPTYGRSAFAAVEALWSAEASADARPLGVPIAQLHGLYILAQNPDGLIVIDTHAAHERVLYEQLKAQYDTSTPVAQRLLEPLYVSAAEHEIEALMAERAELERLGFELERFGPESVVTRAVPVLLARIDSAALLAQLARELAGGEGAPHLDGAAHRILGSIACRAAIRGQRTLSLAEMDALLRQMEHTDRASQCNHGRPTWMRLSLREIDQLFLRGR